MASKYSKLPAKEQLARMRAALAKVKGTGAYQAKGKNFVRGRGAYQSKGRNFVRGKGDFVSDLIGGVTGLGGDIVSAAAKRAGQFITGRGDYKGGVATLAPPAAPRFGGGERSNVISYREYLGDVYGSSEFANTVFNLNPGLGFPENTVEDDAGCFPWLTGIAGQYEKYELLGCMFEFISTSSDAVVADNSSPSLGQVVLATEYNTDREDFSSLTDALNSQFAVSNKPSINFCHVIECSPRDKSQKLHYVRTGPVPAGGDILQYDYAKLNLITQGMPTSDIVGQLWVSYKVRLYSPILQQEDRSQGLLSCHYQFNSTVAPSTPWGTNGDTLEPRDGSTFEMKLETAAQRATFPDNIASGYFMVTYCVKGAATELKNAMSVAGYTNCEVWNILDGSTNSYNIQAVTTPGTATRNHIQFFIKITAPGAAFALGTTWTAQATATSGDLIITEMNSLLTTPPPNYTPTNFWRPSKKYPTAPWAPERIQRNHNNNSSDLLSVLRLLLEEKAVKQKEDEEVDKTKALIKLIKERKAGDVKSCTPEEKHEPTSPGISHGDPDLDEFSLITREEARAALDMVRRQRESRAPAPSVISITNGEPMPNAANTVIKGLSHSKKGSN